MVETDPSLGFGTFLAGAPSAGMKADTFLAGNGIASSPNEPTPAVFADSALWKSRLFGANLFQSAESANSSVLVRRERTKRRGRSGEDEAGDRRGEVYQSSRSEAGRRSSEGPSSSEEGSPCSSDEAEGSPCSSDEEVEENPPCSSDEEEGSPCSPKRTRSVDSSLGGTRVSPLLPPTTRENTFFLPATRFLGNTERGTGRPIPHEHFSPQRIRNKPSQREKEQSDNCEQMESAPETHRSAKNSSSELVRCSLQQRANSEEGAPSIPELRAPDPHQDTAHHSDLQTPDDGHEGAYQLWLDGDRAAAFQRLVRERRTQRLPGDARGEKKAPTPTQQPGKRRAKAGKKAQTTCPKKRRTTQQDRRYNISAALRRRGRTLGARAPRKSTTREGGAGAAPRGRPPDSPGTKARKAEERARDALHKAREKEQTRKRKRADKDAQRAAGQERRRLEAEVKAQESVVVRGVKNAGAQVRVLEEAAEERRLHIRVLEEAAENARLREAAAARRRALRIFIKREPENKKR